MQKLNSVQGLSKILWLQRYAVTALFACNGAVIGSWTVKIPYVARSIDASNAGVGILVFFLGIGAIISIPMCAFIIKNYGSTMILKLTSIGVCFLMLLFSVIDQFWQAASLAVVSGIFLVSMDISMNANAIKLEKIIGRPILSSCHGLWSIGGLFGAGLGGIMLAKLGELVHALFIATLLAALLLSAWKLLIPDEGEGEDEDETSHGAEHQQNVKKSLREHVLNTLPRRPLVYGIGLLSIAAIIPEGAIIDWSALYLREDLNFDAANSGVAYVAFSSTMAIMRFGGDKLRALWGGKTLILRSSLCAMLGLILAGMGNSDILVITGFALCGVGISNLIPVLFAAAGNMPDMNAGVAISTISGISCIGLLLAPASIGWINQWASFGVIFAGLSLSCAFTAIFCGVGKLADSSTETDQAPITTDSV